MATVAGSGGVVTRPHPYCVIAVTLIPVDADGRPVTKHTTVVSGVGGVLLEPDALTVTWRRQESGGLRFTLTGSPEAL